MSAGCSTGSRSSETTMASPSRRRAILLDVTEQHQIEHEVLAYRRELELHAAIATIFLTAPPDRMFTEILGMVREAVGARWGFFGYLDRDGALVAPSLDAEVWDACRVEGKPQRFPEDDMERQHLVPSHPDGTDPGAVAARVSCPRGTCP